VPAAVVWGKAVGGEEVLAADLGGVDADLGGEEVDGSLDGGGGLGTTGPPVGRGGGGVGDHRLGAELGVGMS
jgi:hypothetical protein